MKLPGQYISSSFTAGRRSSPNKALAFVADLLSYMCRQSNNILAFADKGIVFSFFIGLAKNAKTKINSLSLTTKDISKNT